MINPFKDNKWEICYKLINCFLAGLLVFLGAYSDGGVEKGTWFTIFISALIVFVVQFKSYWDEEAQQYKPNKIFSFIG